MKRHAGCCVLAFAVVVATAAYAAAQSPGRLAPPTNLGSLTSGTDVAFFWDRSIDATGYTLQIGSAPDGAEIVDVFVGDVAAVRLSLELGTYFWRVIASTEGRSSAPSAEAQITVNSTCGVPTAPYNLTSSVLGEHVDFNWQPPFLGAVTTYVLEAGSAPGLADRSSVRTGGAQPQVRRQIPDGTYYVRVRAENSCGVSAASNEILAVVGAAPVAPRDLTVRFEGGLMRLAWSVSAGTQPVTDFIVEAGRAPGLANLAMFVTRTTSLTVLRPPPGVYYVRVRARGPTGLSAPSADAVVIVQ